MRKRHFALVPLCAAAGLFFGAGCGGDDELTLNEFIRQADAICVKAEKKREAALEKFLLANDIGFNKPATIKQQEAQTKQVSMPRIQAMTDMVGELDYPDEAEDEVKALIASIERGIKKAEENSEVKLKPGPEGYEDPFEDAAERARTFGFSTCYVNY